VKNLDKQKQKHFVEFEIDEEVKLVREVLNQMKGIITAKRIGEEISQMTGKQLSQYKIKNILKEKLNFSYKRDIKTRTRT
jgi:geranylgeranyl pyrophosphate synthase